MLGWITAYFWPWARHELSDSKLLFCNRNISFAIIKAEWTWFWAFIFWKWNSALCVNSWRFTWTLLIDVGWIKSWIEFMLHLLWLSFSFLVTRSYLWARFSLWDNILSFGFASRTWMINTASKLFVLANEIFAVRNHTTAFFPAHLTAHNLCIWILILGYIWRFLSIRSSWGSRYIIFNGSCLIFCNNLQLWLSSIYRFALRQLGNDFSLFINEISIVWVNLTVLRISSAIYSSWAGRGLMNHFSFISNIFGARLRCLVCPSRRYQRLIR